MSDAAQPSDQGTLRQGARWVLGDGGLVGHHRDLWDEDLQRRPDQLQPWATQGNQANKATATRLNPLTSMRYWGNQI